MEEIAKIEQYLLAKNQDKSDFFQSLVPESTEYYAFKALQLITEKEVLTKEEEQIANKYLRPSGYHHNHHLDLLKNIKEFYAESTTNERRQEILSFLKKEYFLYLVMSYPKPLNYGQQQQQSNNSQQNQQWSSSLDTRNISFSYYLQNLYQRIENTSTPKLEKVNKNALSQINVEALIKCSFNEPQFYYLNTADVHSLSVQNLVDLVESFSKNYERRSNTNNCFNSYYTLFKRFTLEQLIALSQKLPILYTNEHFWSHLFIKQFGTQLALFEDTYSTNNFKLIRDLSITQRRQKAKLLLQIMDWSKTQPGISEYYSQRIQSIALSEILVIEDSLEEYNTQHFFDYLNLNPPTSYNPAVCLMHLNEHYQKKIEEISRQLHEQGLDSLYSFERFCSIYKLNQSYNKQIEGDQQKESQDRFQRIWENALQTSDEMLPFEQFFNSKQLKNYFYLSKLYQGKQFENLHELIDPEYLSLYKDQRLISICSSNNQFLQPDDPVSIEVVLQNISHVSVKIFIINTENYYTKKLCQFDNFISVEGLIPQHFQEFSISQLQNKDDPKQDKDQALPLRRLRKIFSFDFLKQIKRGIFIIDFTGDGVTSRAVVKKGALIYVGQKTLAGHRLTIVGEDNQICQPPPNLITFEDDDNSKQQQKQTQINEEIEGAEKTSLQKTGIWVKGRYYESNDDGHVLIPYGKTQEVNIPIVLVHNGFAEISYLNICPESYVFKCALIYNEESFISGNKAKIVVQPRLFINGVAANMKIISEPSISAVVYNERNIPITYAFNKSTVPGFTFDHKEDIQIELPIKSLVSKIDITVTGIINMLNGDIQNLSHTEKINFNLYESDFVFTNMYLRQDDKLGYVLLVLGKNGEPKKGILVDIEITHNLYQDHHNALLCTDAFGQIILGKLEDIVQVKATQRATADIQAPKQSRCWQIQNTTSIQYPSLINIIEGDVIALPAITTEISRNVYSLYQFYRPNDNSNENQVIQDCLRFIVYDNNRFYIKGLKAGSYQLTIKKQFNQIINISVIKGQYWPPNSATYIISQDFEDKNSIGKRFLEVGNSSSLTNNIQILSMEIQQKQQQQQQTSPSKLSQKQNNLVDLNINVCLPENYKSGTSSDLIRAHVIAINYQPENLNEYAQKLRQLSVPEQLDMIKFANTKSLYFSNKLLGDEICYILNRQNQCKKKDGYSMLGNTLEKPPLLLKRTMNQETSFNKEQLLDEKPYEMKEGKDIDSPRRVEDYNIPYGDMEKEMDDQKILRQRRMAPREFSGLDSMLNFLDCPSQLFCNLRVSSQSESKVAKIGTIVVRDFPLNKYKQIIVILSNISATVCQIFTIPQIDTPLRDLTLVSRLKSNLQYCQKYSVHLVKAGGAPAIVQSDYDFIILDSCCQLFDVQKELRQATYGNDNENDVGYKFWDFLKEWMVTVDQNYSDKDAASAAMDYKTKLEKYNKNSCHELNIFLYFKDYTFFEEVVRPFIRNKIEKRFVDYFLLNDKDNLNVYAQPQNLDKLNAMEQCLMIIFLCSNGQFSKAKALSEAMTLQVKAQSFDKALKRKLYETVIEAKAKSGRELKELKKIEEQIKMINSNIDQSKSCDMLMEQLEMKCANIEIKEACFKQKSSVVSSLSSMFGGLKKMARKKEIREEQCYMMKCEEREECCDEIDMDYDQPRCPPPGGVNQQSLSNLIQDDRLQQDAMKMLDDNEADQLLEKRKQFRPAYEKLKSTKEYTERTYLNMKDPKQSRNLIKVNEFWADLASYLINHFQQKPLQQKQNKPPHLLISQNFLTESFIYATQCHAEMLCALAFIGLSNEQSSYNLSAQPNRAIAIQPSEKHNLIIFCKDIVQGETMLCGDLQVTQRFFDPHDQYTYLEDEPNIRVEKPVDQEFIVDKAYGIETIVTNCSVANLEFDILAELPQGAIPIHSTHEYTHSEIKLINSYTTVKSTRYFYFPKPCPFQYYSSTVSRNELVMARAVPSAALQAIKQVQPVRTIFKSESFTDILAKGNKDEILRFLKEKNILNPNIFKFEQIYFLLLDDKDFYQQAITILQERAIFDFQTWAFSAAHGDIKTFKQLLNSAEFKNKYFLSNDSTFQIKYIQNQDLQFDSLRLFEYFPLLSARYHKFMNQAKSKIDNVQFKQTYENFIKYLSFVPYTHHKRHHYLTWTYYLLLQERVSEAIAIFQRFIAPYIQDEQISNQKQIQQTTQKAQVDDPSEAQIQIDYLRGFLDMYTGYPKFTEARIVSKKYLDYPVISWRNLFIELHNQITEFDDETQKNQEMNSKDQQQQKETQKIIIQAQKGEESVDNFKKNLKSAEIEEILEAETEHDFIILRYSNLEKITLSFYEVDLEILFSRQPFMAQIGSDFSFVKPKLIQVLQVSKKEVSSTLKKEIPSSMRNNNLFISIQGTNKIIGLNYFPATMHVQLIERYGQVKVIDQSKVPLPKVYIKVYAKNKQTKQVLFYRDGYTDMRGRFDYALSSNSDIKQVELFALFIHSDDFGSILKEAPIPSEQGSIEDDQI